DFAHARDQRAQERLELELREVSARAAVHAMAEAEVIARVARHVESIGIAIAALVAVRRAEQHEHALPFRNRDAVDVIRLRREPRERAYGRLEAQRLVH